MDEFSQTSRAAVSHAAFAAVLHAAKGKLVMDLFKHLDDAMELENVPGGQRLPHSPA